MKSTTLVTVYVRKDGNPVQVFGRIPETSGCTAWIGHPGFTLKPGECNSFWIGVDQDLLLSEVKQ